MSVFWERVFATIIGGLVILAVNFGLKATAIDATERRYYMAFGGMYCSQREMTACGIRLSKCTDGEVYECLHNVHWEAK